MVTKGEAEIENVENVEILILKNKGILRSWLKICGNEFQVCRIEMLQDQMG